LNARGIGHAKEPDMHRVIPPVILVLSLIAKTTAGTSARGQHDAGAAHHLQPTTSAMKAGEHAHGPLTPAITYAELQRTAEQLAAARRATAKYQDVRAAEADGYRAIGPNVPGMGIHYVRQARAGAFSIENPPILLYEKDPALASLRLVGVSYLIVAPSDANGQPAKSPFPKGLASWHKHNNICVLPDNSASVELTEAQCTVRGGRFTGETSWMVHAWIWKESPTGVFSPTNPSVK
jgi:uncharacterized protein YdbL (DUF1318 family)